MAGALTAFVQVRGLETSSCLLGLPEDHGDFVDLGQQVVGHRNVPRGLGAAGSGELGGLVEQCVQLRVLLEVRRLEVVGPQHPQVVFDQVRALFLDDEGAGLEVGIAGGGSLDHAGLDGLGLDLGLGRVVDSAGQVAVGADLNGSGKQTREHVVGPFDESSGCGDELTGLGCVRCRPGARLRSGPCRALTRRAQRVWSWLWLSLTSWTSSLTFSTVRSGVGVTCCTCFLPTSAAIPAARKSTNVTINAAAHRGSTRSNAMIAVAIRAPRPNQARTPATLNSPAPRPACLAEFVSSTLASCSSERTKVEVCSDNWLIN